MVGMSKAKRRTKPQTATKPLRRKTRSREQTGRVPPLEDETRLTVDTATAAFHLSRRPQTLRVWASAGSGPITPARVNGRLACPVEPLRVLLRTGIVPHS